jgi:hypothetical protein
MVELKRRWKQLTKAKKDHYTLLAHEQIKGKRQNP